MEMRTNPGQGQKPRTRIVSSRLGSILDCPVFCESFSSLSIETAAYREKQHRLGDIHTPGLKSSFQLLTGHITLRHPHLLNVGVSSYAPKCLGESNEIILVKHPTQCLLMAHTQ